MSKLGLDMYLRAKYFVKCTNNSAKCQCYMCALFQISLTRTQTQTHIHVLKSSTESVYNWHTMKEKGGSKWGTMKRDRCNREGTKSENR